MQKYSICGIGNALVDMEFEVSDAFLSDNGIAKGQMTLIDKDQHDRQFNTLAEQFGVSKQASGGSAANTVVAAAQLGANTFYNCRVANDEAGDYYLDDLADAGVKTATGITKADGLTGKCLVMVTPDAERTMNTYLGITADFESSDIDERSIIDSEYVYIEGYLMSAPNALNAALTAQKIAQDNGVKVAFTFSDPAMVQFCADGIKQVLANGVDILFCNEQEATDYTGLSDVTSAAKKLLDSAQQVVITEGAKGASLFTAETRFQSPALDNVNVIDTNGAGDMFAGAMMYALVQQWPEEKALTLANAAAAATVQTLGARLPISTLTDIKNSIA